MKKLRIHALRLEIYQVACMLFFIGIIVGAVFANVFQNGYIDELKAINLKGLDNISTLDINYGSLLFVILKKNLKSFFLLWLFSITILGIPYMIFFILYSGFSAGFIIAVCSIQFKIKGMLVFLGYIFPQYIIYIPVYLITLSKGYTLCIEMYDKNNQNKKGKMSLFIENFFIILILAFFLILGSIVETYVNTLVIQKISQIIIH